MSQGNDFFSIAIHEGDKLYESLIAFDDVHIIIP